MNINELAIHKRTMEAREGRYVEYPEQLLPEIKGYLSEHGMERLYSHQAEMFAQAQEKKNIVITTSTASGKTLSFLLPVLQEILQNPLSRALFIYPTKALASDQFRALLPYMEYFGENRISAGVYDGDTPVSERSRIRKSANIILTNPEMLNGAFLPNHSKYGFDFIFSNLKFVVIDELHTYRGAFGSHLANVFRRLGRICRYYNAQPQYLCSSATISNPLELAEGICGKQFVQIAKDGSPAAERNYVLLQPPKMIRANNHQYMGQVQSTTVAAELLPKLVDHKISFIAFAKSRRNVEVILKESRDKLASETFLGEGLMNQIAGYRGGYTPMERKEIEQKMIQGALTGLVSTNALELGIDIGKIESTVLVGYPGTRASFWQQTGRAGRAGKASTSYLILEQQPFDQYIAMHPEWLFEGGNENAVIDPNNLLIELAHIRAAAAELPLTLDDISVFPDLGETIPVLLRASELSSQNGKFAWSGNSFPAGDFSLRNIDRIQFKLINQENHKEITEMDELQAYHELHTGAIYLHEGVQYQVVRMDVESHTAYGIPFMGNYYTMPGSNTEIKILQEMKKETHHRITYAFGDVNVDEVVYMYKKLQFHNHQNLGYEQLEAPLSKDYDTESIWIRIPENVVLVFRRLLQVNPSGTIVRNNHFEGLCYAIQSAARMCTMTDQGDIGVVMSNNAVTLAQTVEDDVYLFLYDKYVGGLGYAEKAYDLVPEIIQNAIHMVTECSCEKGCVACIGDYKLDKKVVAWGLKNFLEELEAPKDMKLAEYAPATFLKKDFLFAELPEKWKEFCSYVLERGDSMAEFINSVPGVAVEGNRITLLLGNSFYKEWVMEPTNRKSLSNILEFYTEAPAMIEIQVSAPELEEEHFAVRDKLAKRYGTLMDTSGEKE